MTKNNEIRSVEDGIAVLTKKYGYSSYDYRLDGNMITMGSKQIPLYPWRWEGRFAEMKKMLWDGSLGHICSIRAMCTAEKSRTLKEILYRELDLCLWWAEMKPVNIFCVMNDICANVIMRFENNADLILEAAATLPDGSESVERHEIFTDHGTVLDQAIDTQLKQPAMITFINGSIPKSYTDTDWDLYGLSSTDCAFVRCAFDVLCGKTDIEDAISRDLTIRSIIDAAFMSSETKSVISF